MGKKFISIVLSVFMVVGNITVGVNANGDISCDESNELTGEEIVASSNDARVNVTEDETLIQSEKEDVDKADDVWSSVKI